MRGFSVLLDYRPRRVDVAALRDGSLVELLNLVPWGGIDISFKGLTLAGIQGWDGIGATAAREWLRDIAGTQAHKFLVGIAPVNHICKVGSAVASLLMAPIRQLSSPTLGALPGQGGGGSASLPGGLSRSLSAASQKLRRNKLALQVRRSVLGLTRVLLLEAMGLGANVVAGAQAALQAGQGDSGATRSASFKGAVKQAAAKLQALLLQSRSSAGARSGWRGSPGTKPLKG